MSTSYSGYKVSDMSDNPFLPLGERERFVSYANAIKGAYETTPYEGSILAGHLIALAMEREWTYPVPVRDMFRGVANRAHKRALSAQRERARLADEQH